MGYVVDNYKRIVEKVAEIAVKCGRDPNNIQILPVSKTQSLEKIMELAESGIRFFGENKVQEALPKIEAVKNKWDDAVFHFIGRFQTNKANKIVENFSLIHSIDRLEAVRFASEAAAKQGKVCSILIQVNLAEEVQKNGVAANELQELLEVSADDKNIRLKGLMMMPPYEEDPEVNRKYFKAARYLFDKYRKIYPTMTILSMGMSQDYKIAVEEGATLLRLGTIIFGTRS